MTARAATRWPLGLLLMIVMLAVLAAPAGARSQHRSKVVVLVSGLDSSTPFSTPAAACASDRGDSWGLPDGIADALGSAGYRVFTAPVRAGADSAPPAPCGPRVPGRSTWLNSRGDIDANGAALDRFLGFLRRAYGVRAVTLIGHSDGGLWSRSAIAGAHRGPAIQGLVTLGTPYTGSFVADVGTEVSDLACGVADPTCATLQSTTQALLAPIGAVAVRELTSSFMSTWNPRVSIAGCGVTAIQGRAVSAGPLPATQPRLSAYYVPSDGLVGLASGADRSARSLDGTKIPAAPLPTLAQGGSFPAYHLPALGNPSELNDPAIDRALVRALRRPAVACVGARLHRASVLTLRFRTARGTGAQGGTLGDAGPGDLVLATPGTTVSCGAVGLASSPLLPLPVLDAFVTGRCSRLTTGGTALLLHDSRSSVGAAVTGTRLAVRATGPPIRGVHAAVAANGGWRRVRLRRGTGTVPRGNRIDLRVTGRNGRGQLVAAAGVLAR